jgi:putative membrane-bound dehydrogenase-like protein
MRRSSGYLLLAGLVSWSAARADAPVPPKEAPLRMTLPAGFHASLFAGEPDVVQPIAFTFDDRGRLWVAECYSYPNWQQTPGEGKDRILIFEDTDGDGRFDVRKVFHSKIANISGLQYGFGGVWVCASPNLLFIPDRDGDDVPDGPPEIVLDGWSLKARHNVFNGLIWGPDGWLYGCNGIVATSLVGVPGTPDAQRTPMNCGVWRYHPLQKKFEVVASGTTNPWGLDFDDHGEMFITNCVIHHLWHVVPGAHFQRMYGQDLTPNCYELMGSIADHIHWGGGPWTSSRGGQGTHSEAGGGHAHSGAMIYLGDNWPGRYRNGAFMCNIHGNRINHDLLERQGSTYRARHGQDVMLANDPWFRGLALQYGPDGAVYVIDWSDTGECHNYKVVDRTNGRIFKIAYGKPAHKSEDLAKLSDAELVRRQLHVNDWHVRHARRLLHERAAQGTLAPETAGALRKILNEHPDVTRRLRALWALHCIGAAKNDLLAKLADPSEYVRAWAIRLALEAGMPDFAKQLSHLAQEDSSPFVRLTLASSLHRLPTAERWHVAAQLVRHQEDAQDLYLPLMYWYGIEPLVAANPVRALSLLADCQIPLVREYITRRLVSLDEQSGPLEGIVQYLAKIDDPIIHRDVLRGLQEGLGDRRHIPLPKSWAEAYPLLRGSPLAEVREKGLALAVQFGDERALALLRDIVRAGKQTATSRHAALSALLFQQEPGLVPLLQQLLADPVLRSQAVRGLAAFDNAETPHLLLKNYPAWSTAEKADVLHTLASRPSYALALLGAIGKVVPRAEVNAFTIRQMQALKNESVNGRLEIVWGNVRPASQEKAALLPKYRGALTAEKLKNANLANGRLLYGKTCAACHRLFGEGGDVAPDLTGSQRTNLDYVLENVLDPSAIVPKDYQVSILQTRSGQVITGIIKQETDKALTVQTQNDRLVVPLDEIEARSPSRLSMMPEGLFEQLRLDEVRDLVGYLASPVQVPLLNRK